MAKVIQAKFRIEGGATQIHAFQINARTTDEAVEEIRDLIAGEWKVHKVDVEVLQIGDDPLKLKDAPEPKERLPNPEEVGKMRKANLEVLAKQLGIDGDYDKIKVKDLADLVNKAIEDRLTAPAS